MEGISNDLHSVSLNSQNIGATSTQRNAYCPKTMNELQNDTVSFGSAEKAEGKKNIKKYLLWAGAAVLTVAGGFLCKPLFNKISNLRKLAKNEGALKFLESAKKQNAEIIQDTVKKYHDSNARVITKKLPSGAKVTQVYLEDIDKPFSRIVETSKFKSCTNFDGDWVTNSITKYSDGTGKLSGYCAFYDEAGEYLQLTPKKPRYGETGWNVYTRMSKSKESLPVELNGGKVEKGVGRDGWKSIDFPELDSKFIKLKQVNEAEIGYPFGPNPFDLAKN